VKSQNRVEILEPILESFLNPRGNQVVQSLRWRSSSDW
jgi:hypothetical protein